MRTYALLLVSLAACGENLTETPARRTYQPGEPTPLGCLPNLDGQLTAAELPTVLDTPASYLVSPADEERAVDVVGEVNAQGQREWDWSLASDADALVELAAEPVNGRWYADRFPAGEFVTRDLSGRLETIYRRDAGALYILGFASTEPSPPEGRTLLVYSSGAALYRFPLAQGDTFESTGEVRDGVYRGLPFASVDTYRVEVDGVGRLHLPDLTFTQALRVLTRAEVDPAIGPTTSVRQVSYLFECFGEVARATSRKDEPNEEFTVATEVRKLGL